MELENLFENINLDYNYNSNENLQIVEEILSTQNINEIYKMCVYIKKNFTINENHLIYNNLPVQQKQNIKRIRELIETILGIYPHHPDLMIRHFYEFYMIMKDLCFT